MKITHLFLAVSLLRVTGLLAQAPSPSPTPSVSAPAETSGPGNRKERRKEMIESLTPEERQKLATAHKAALEDPAVKAAEPNRATNKKAYHEALRAAMLKSDPSVGAIMAKMKAERKQDRIF